MFFQTSYNKPAFRGFHVLYSGFPWKNDYAILYILDKSFLVLYQVFNCSDLGKALKIIYVSSCKNFLCTKEIHNIFCILITFDNPINAFFQIRNILLHVKRIFLIEKMVLTGFLKITGIQNKFLITFGTALILI